MERIVPLVLHPVRVAAPAAPWGRREDALVRRLVRVVAAGDDELAVVGKYHRQQWRLV